MRKYLLLLTLVVAFAWGCSRNGEMTSADKAADKSQPKSIERVSRFYSVNDYDPKRDPAVDLVATIQQAEADNKRIILEIGGHW